MKKYDLDDDDYLTINEYKYFKYYNPTMIHRIDKPIISLINLNKMKGYRNVDILNDLKMIDLKNNDYDSTFIYTHISIEKMKKDMRKEIYESGKIVPTDILLLLEKISNFIENNYSISLFDVDLENGVIDDADRETAKPPSMNPEYAKYVEKCNKTNREIQDKCDNKYNILNNELDFEKTECTKKNREIQDKCDNKYKILNNKLDFEKTECNKKYEQCEKNRLDKGIWWNRKYKVVKQKCINDKQKCNKINIEKEKCNKINKELIEILDKTKKSFANKHIMLLNEISKLKSVKSVRNRPFYKY